ncbi:hypothetical protein D3C73_663840 [compost metagenome]
MNPKILKKYASDLKHFISWFETADHQVEEVLFRFEDVATPTLTRYREAAQKVMELKPAAYNPETFFRVGRVGIQHSTRPYKAG